MLRIIIPKFSQNASKPSSAIQNEDVTWAKLASKGWFAHWHGHSLNRNCLLLMRIWQLSERVKIGPLHLRWSSGLGSIEKFQTVCVYLTTFSFERQCAPLSTQ